MIKYLIYISSLIAICHLQPTIAGPIQSKKLLTNPNFTNIQISPNGKYITARYKDNKVHNITLINAENNDIISNLTIGLDTKLISYHWLNNEQLYFSGKYKNKVIPFIGTIEGQKINFKVSMAEGYLVDTLPKEPNTLMFAKRKNSSHFDLYIINIDDFINNNFKPAKKIKHNDDIIFYYYDKTFNQILTIDYDDNTKKISIKKLPKKGGRWKTIVNKKIEDSEFDIVGVFDEDNLAVLSNQTTDKVSLQRFNISKQKFEDTIYQHPKFDLKNAKINKDGKLIYVSYEQHGLIQFDYFNQTSKRLAKKFSNTFKGREFFSVDRSADHNRMIIFVQGSTEPGEYLVYDYSKDILHRLLNSYPDLTKKKFFPSKIIKTKTEDGDEIESFLTLAGEKFNHSTLLVMPHGGPIGVKEDDRFNPTVQYYASRGFSILRVNFRGSEGFGKEFKKRGVGEFGRLIEKDISSVIKNISKKYKFNNMCAVGSSYGGYSSVMLAMKHPNKYQCVVASFGLYDFPLIYNQNNHVIQEDVRKLIEKTFGPYNKELKNYSPVYFSEKLKTPILLIAGIEDEIANFEQTHRFEYMLKKHNQPVETMYYKDTGHGHNLWSGDRHQEAVSYDFIMRTLKLSYPKLNKMTKSEKLAIADDFVNIADAYYFGENIDKNEKKAFEYYEKSAKFEHPRANFNIGAYYHRGDQVNKDVEKAIEYYKQSARLDNENANRRLGRMYSEGDFLKQDWRKSLSHLNKALKIEDSPENYMQLAKFRCIAPAPYRDNTLCLKLMDLRKFKRRSENTFKRAVQELQTIIPSILTDAEFSKSERKIVDKLILDAFNLTETRVEIDSKRIGAFEFIEGKGYGNLNKYNDISQGGKLKKTEKENHYFGIIFEVDIPGNDSYSDKTAVVAKWSKNMADGSIKPFSSTVLYTSPESKWYLLKSFKVFEDASSITLDILDLNGNKLLNQTFTIDKEI